MFKPEDFQLSMEKELKLRVVNDDIMRCKDVEILQNSLKLKLLTWPDTPIGSRW